MTDFDFVIKSVLLSLVLKAHDCITCFKIAFNSFLSQEYLVSIETPGPSLISQKGNLEYAKSVNPPIKVAFSSFLRGSALLQLFADADIGGKSYCYVVFKCFLRKWYLCSIKNPCPSLICQEGNPEYEKSVNPTIKIAFSSFLRGSALLQLFAVADISSKSYFYVVFKRLPDYARPGLGQAAFLAATGFAGFEIKTDSNYCSNFITSVISRTFASL